MGTFEIDGFKLTKDHVKRLLNELRKDGVQTEADVKHYLRGHWYTRDTALKSHLLLSKHPKKKKFALPFDEG